MARIRTVKPEFFRHEKLQELGPLSMLIFEGLWTQCDRAGRFAWRPKTLKLDILPFIPFDMEAELTKLADAFFLVKYEAEKEFFGVIPTFLDHQRLTGKEAIEPAKFPAPPEGKTKKTRKLPALTEGSVGETLGKHSGSDETKPVSQEGKGNGDKEREGKGNGDFFLPGEIHFWFSDSDFQKAWDGWEEMRKHEKPKLSDHARKLNFTELQKHSGDDCSKAVAIINKSVASGWKGFFPLKEDFNGSQNGSSGRGRRESRAERLDRDATEAFHEFGGAQNGNPPADKPDFSVLEPRAAGSGSNVIPG